MKNEQLINKITGFVILVDQFGERIKLPRQTAFTMFYDDLTTTSDEEKREQCASVLYGLKQQYPVVNMSWNY